MYTEDGFELRPVGDTMEVYASGELFHEPSPPVFKTFRMLVSHRPVSQILCDLRQATYIFDPEEVVERAAMTAEVLTGYRTAFVGLSDQDELIGLIVENMLAGGTPAAQFSSKQAARDWLSPSESLVPSHTRRRTKPALVLAPLPRNAARG